MARLERRIAQVRHAIEQAGDRGAWSADMGERERMLALLATTLSALEARKEVLLTSDR